MGPGDCPHDAQLLNDIKTTERVAHWCGRYTPWTATDDSGGIWLDITGCQHLFGGEHALMNDMAGRFQAQNIAMRAAVADTPGAAWAAARFGTRMDITVVESGAQREILSPLPVAALRLSSDAAEGLRRLGLRRIGDLYPMPRGPVAARFGAETLKRLDQALGRRDEPLSPIRPVPSNRVRMTFPDPIGLTHDLWAGFVRLLDALLQRLEQSDEGVRCLELTGYRADGTVARLMIGIGAASRDGDHIERLMREKFDTFDPGFGIEVMTLAATSTDPLPCAQHDLSGTSAVDANFAKLKDRLANRLGIRRLGHIGTAESHIPERAFTRDIDPVVSTPSAAQSPRLTRPLHLLSPPEPVETMAPVPDGPPVMFQWRRQTHRIVRADGPERIAPEWWLEDPACLAAGHNRARDYYRVEDETGARYWLFRAGLYQSDKAPTWYVHGLFP